MPANCIWRRETVPCCRATRSASATSKGGSVVSVADSDVSCHTPPMGPILAGQSAQQSQEDAQDTEDTQQRHPTPVPLVDAVRVKTMTRVKAIGPLLTQFE